VSPAVAFPGKDQAVARAPEQLVLCPDFAEGASPSFFSSPDLAPGASRPVRDADRPGLCSPLGPEYGRLLRSGNADERDLVAVRRPRGLEVAVDARIDVSQSLRGEVVNADQAVVAAPAHKRQPR